MKEQGYQYTTDLLVIGCGFSGMWAAMRARDFLGDVLVVDKGPRDWGGLGGLSGVALLDLLRRVPAVFVPAAEDAVEIPPL
mgnify:FL=1